MADQVKVSIKDLKAATKVVHSNQRVLGREGRVDVVAFYDQLEIGTLLTAYAKLPTGNVKVLRLGTMWFQPSRCEVAAEVLAL